MEDDIRNWFDDILTVVHSTLDEIQKLKMEIVGRDENYKRHEYKYTFKLK